MTSPESGPWEEAFLETSMAIEKLIRHAEELEDWPMRTRLAQAQLGLIRTWGLVVEHMEGHKLPGPAEELRDRARRIVEI